MKMLVVGLGSVGQRHVRNLRTLLGSELEIVAYRVRGLPHTLADQANGSSGEEYDIRTHRTLEQALAENPVAVLICNPSSLHIPIALSAAQAGCHLFIEKPVSHTLDGLDRLAALVQEKRLRVLVGFQFRFHPGLRMVKQWIDEGAIGKIVCAHAHWGEYLPDWHPGEDYRHSYSSRSDLGGGVILTLCHPFDYLRWLLGEVKVVSGVAGCLSGLELDVEDTADITLEFASDVIGTVHLDYAQRPASHWLQITGQAGTIRWDNADGLAECYRSDRGEWERFPLPPGFVRNTMFLEEQRHFLECIAGRSEPLVTLDDGIRALEIALAAKRSAAKGQVVEV
jgi:predicted dehydrogenase